ncbi:MAG: fibrobacter succinogenes major paralogous domain-containing protein [Fibrobacter sp.]|nr:fibrobacter succinogenes major paralogous domain-containing protein [Fibrobacter sp.]
MALKKFLMIGCVAAVLVACGDDSSFAPRNDEPSSSVEEESSSSVTPDSVPGAQSSISMKSSSSSSSVIASDAKQSKDSKSSSSKAKSSSSKNGDAGTRSSSSGQAPSGMTSSSAKSSSSSSAKSSSSLAKLSSSSVAYLEPCRTDSVDTCEYGILTDERDGQTYKTVKIGEQVWMAENLNYAYTGVPFIYGGITTDSITWCLGDDESSCKSRSDSTRWWCFHDDEFCLFTSDSSSWCYNDDPANCAKYGRLYTWAAAIDSVKLVNDAKDPQDCGDGKICTLPAKVQGICPTGWHLPNETEWKTLFTAVGSIVAGSYSDAYYHSAAGKMLKSTNGWKDYELEGRKNGNGMDAFGFSALPAGDRFLTGDFSNEGKYASFWCSAELNRYHACHLDLYYGNSATLQYPYKSSAYSVRCVKD